MSSAIQLNAVYSIINGEGLATSSNMISAISSFQNNQPITILANIYSTINGANANVRSNLISVVSNIGAGVTNGTWLLDLYPSNVTPECSGNITYYISGTARFSNTLQTQSTLPFSYGMSGFANVYSTVFGYVNSAFDIVSSANILQGKTYAQSGIGYSGPQDLATVGVGGNTQLMANAVVNFGTMYDITKISNFGDPYVFGQNLINQGLGIFGNLSTQLTNAGLNINNLSAIPQSITTTTQQSSTIATQSPIGQINLPYQQTVTTTTPVSGNSLDVVIAIYKSITGADLDAIIASTQIIVPSTSTINSLADFLILKNIVNPSTYTALSALGITDITGLSKYLQSKVGKGTYSSWSDLANFLNSITVPILSYTTSNANSVLLSNNIINSINSTYGNGSGPFGNPVLIDYLGAVNGWNYINNFSIIENNYQTISNSINLISLLNTLESDILSYINYIGGYSGSLALLNTIKADVATLNTTLNTIPASTSLSNCNNAYYAMINQIQTEVNNLSKTNVEFNSGNPSSLQNFASQIGRYASDKTQFLTYQFFSNLITNDVYGDTIRSAIAETINTGLAQSKGFNVTNDPNPTLAIYQSQSQNIPLSTYISQNQ